MPDIRWTPRAEAELFDIAEGIGRWSERAADRLVDRMYDLSGLLVDHPRLGRRRDDIIRGSRSLVENDVYVILYRTLPDTDEGPVDVVEIVSVVDGRRDLASIFRRARD